MGNARIVFAAVALAAGAPAAMATGITERVSIGHVGAQANANSALPAISVDGRFVAFLSGASNLVPDDTNGTADIFVRDRWQGITERISVGRNGVQANGSSYSLAISPGGWFVAFGSDASNLVPGDTNGQSDVFVRDRWRGTTERVSVGRNGTQANGSSFGSAISVNGRFVAFDSGASNLVPGDTNGETDVFVRDRWTGQTERINVGRVGVQADQGGSSPGISLDGRFVTFVSAATNLVPGDPTLTADIFVRDRRAGRTELVSIGLGGIPANDRSTEAAAISLDGRIVAFESDASNLVSGDTNGTTDIFVRDRRAGVTRRVNVGPGGVQAATGGFDAALSLGGRFVGFVSNAGNLVPGDTNGVEDVFLRDRRTGRIERVSVGTDSAQGNSFSFSPAIAANGRFVAFSSFATNLVPGDTNGVEDIFVRIR